jgi:hypothetical protein
MITKEEMITLRNAKAEIEDRYASAKREALNSAIEKMCKTKQGYTALQISADTGLSVPCIARNLHNDRAVSRRIDRKKIYMVALDEDGVPNMAQIFTKVKRQAIWYVPNNSYYMNFYNEKHKPTAPKEETNPTSVGGAMVKAMIEKYSG